MKNKEQFILCIKDAVANLFYYDRKNDDELKVADVEFMVEKGEITLKEIIEAFSNEIKENFPNIKIE